MMLLIVFPIVAVVVLTVMEGRRKQQRLGQERLIELSTLLESMPEAVFIFNPSGEIAAHFPDVTGPAVSQHLRVLREAGLIEERRSGTRRLYRARPEGLAELRALLRDFWDDTLAQLQDAAEVQQRRKGPRRGHQ